MYDLEFHVFLELNKLLDKLFPNDVQYTLEQVKAIHEFARKIARDVQTGEYCNHGACNV